MKMHSVRVSAADLKFIGEEPEWTTLADPFPYTKELLRGLNWHQYASKIADCWKFIEYWIHEHSPELSEVYETVPESAIDRTMAALARMAKKGFPLSELDRSRVDDHVKEIAVKRTRVKKEGPPPKKVNVQDNIRAQVEPLLANLDTEVQNALSGKPVNVTDVVGKIVANELKPAHLRVIREHLEKYTTEWKTACEGDAELMEGYSYIGKRALKKVLASFEEIVQKVITHNASLQVNVVRKKRPVDKKKLVGKLQYLKEFQGLNSIDPVEILGATRLWAYDTGTRKIVVFEGEAEKSLYVKGTTILGTKSIQTKLFRWPDEQLKEFAKLRSAKTIQKWIDDLTTRYIDAKGRTNDRMLLLKVDK